MNPVVLNVSTGGYVFGQDRLEAAVRDQGYEFLGWRDTMPPGSPSHHDIQYAFKSWSLKEAAKRGHTLLLWADASIMPVSSMAPLWAKIEADGYWLSKNGWSNAQWTADSAYADLGVTIEENRQIPHVVATTFGLNLAHPKGKAIFDEYFRLAQTGAFRGPWKNGPANRFSRRTGPCGPPDVLGHRHDQTALSVVAWRNGCELTDPPAWFAYQGGQTKETVLVADGALFAGKMPPQ